VNLDLDHKPRSQQRLLGTWFPHIVTALRSKSSPLGPINRIGELLPNRQPQATKQVA
jgi:hypothetical protein